MTGTILVTTDGSDTANRAIDCAAELAVKLDRRLCILHVLMHGRPPEEMTRLAEVEHLVQRMPADTARPGRSGQRSLADFVADAEDETQRAKIVVALGDQIVARARHRAQQAGVESPATLVTRGDYASEILDVAAAEGATMIVLGRRGLGRVREVLLGSVSQKVLHHATATVVIVR